jgi:hypothetical protein
MRKRLSRANSHWVDWFRRADISGFTFVNTRQSTSRNRVPKACRKLENFAIGAAGETNRQRA